MSAATDKTAGLFGPSSAEREQALRQFYGNKLLSSAGAGLGAGVGATAIYQLLRTLKQPGKKEKKYEGYGSGTPMIAKAALDAGSLSRSLGGLLPTGMVPGGGPHFNNLQSPSADPYAWRKAWSTAANIGGAAGGAMLGHKLINHLVKAKQKRDTADALETAKQEYYAALSGGHKAAAALDTAFENVKAANLLGGAASALYNTPQAVRTMYLLSMLGAGGAGAKYMYDRTKARSESENLAKAQASRARMRGLPAVWVDPESLANVKALANNNE